MVVRGSLDREASLNELRDRKHYASIYWIADVQNTQIYAVEMFVGEASPSENRGSRRIDRSLVFPNLSIATIAEALNRSKEADQSQFGQWLMSQFQG